MRRRKILASLVTSTFFGFAGCGTDSQVNTKSSPQATTPTCGEEPTPTVRIENALAEEVTLSLEVMSESGGTSTFDERVTLPPASDGEFSVTTLNGVAPGQGRYVATASANNRTETYEWNVKTACDDLLAVQLTDDGLRFVIYGEG